MPVGRPIRFLIAVAVLGLVRPAGAEFPRHTPVAGWQQQRAGN